MAMQGHLSTNSTNKQREKHVGKKITIFFNEVLFDIKFSREFIEI